jgi:histidinol-phosphate phosphatase family protein
VRPAIFLDRDGVIIENCDHYVRSWTDVSFIPAAIKALRWIAPLDVAVIVATNQAGVGKGIITLKLASEINQRIVSEVRAHNGRIDAAYLCPHRPEDNCDCRKPKPGMLVRASREWGIDLARSIMIGDAITDMQAAQAAGVRGILVKTGRGEVELNSFDGVAWFEVADDLAHAIAQVSQLSS